MIIQLININYNIGSNSTAVTSGSKDTKSLIYYENKNFKIDKRFKKIREVTKEIIKKTNQDDLDIEFAIDDKNRTYILQIRNLIIPKNKRKLNSNRLNEFNKLSKKSTN